jgi:hypothetical protein
MTSLFGNNPCDDDLKANEALSADQDQDSVATPPKGAENMDPADIDDVFDPTAMGTLPMFIFQGDRKALSDEGDCAEEQSFSQEEDAQVTRAALSWAGLKGPMYLHTVLCQTSFPFRELDRSEDWERRNGMASLYIQRLCNVIYTYDENEQVHEEKMPPSGVPWGAKAKLILAFLSQQAVVRKKSEIWMGRNITHFVSEALRLAPTGRNIAAVREQLMRLTDCQITLGMTEGGKECDVLLNIRPEPGRMFDGKHTPWPSFVDLSLTYFHSLLDHAVPLGAEHMHQLLGNAMSMDIYAWLVQRLPRVRSERPYHLSWQAVLNQFGQGRTRLDNFRGDFRVALDRVKEIYPDAHVTEIPGGRNRVVTENGRSAVRRPVLGGLILESSPPPVPKKIEAKEDGTDDKEDTGQAEMSGE